MRRWARIVAIVSFAVLFIDFFTLENRVVTTNPLAQEIGLLVGILTLAVFTCSTLFLIGGTLARPPARQDTSLDAAGGAGGLRVPKVPGARWRVVKVATGLLVLLSWFVGMPLYAYWNLIAKSPDFSPGPWVADAFLSVFAVAVQVTAPTPIALAFWPSAAMAVYLVFSRKARPVLDALFGVSSLGLVLLLWYVLAFDVQLGRP
ncbi:MAG: hypothetical protein ACM3X4_00815 [Ignavibacteriales bacterium]